MAMKLSAHLFLSDNLDRYAFRRNNKVEIGTFVTFYHANQNANNDTTKANASRTGGQWHSFSPPGLPGLCWYQTLPEGQAKDRGHMLKHLRNGNNNTPCNQLKFIWAQLAWDYDVIKDTKQYYDRMAKWLGLSAYQVKLIESLDEANGQYFYWEDRRWQADAPGVKKADLTALDKLSRKGFLHMQDGHYYRTAKQLIAVAKTVKGRTKGKFALCQEIAKELNITPKGVELIHSLNQAGGRVFTKNGRFWYADVKETIMANTVDLTQLAHLGFLRSQNKQFHLTEKPLPVPTPKVQVRSI